MSFHTPDLWSHPHLDTNEWLPNEGILDLVDTAEVAVTGIVLDGQSAPSIYHLPETFKAEKIGSFANASHFYGVDSLGEEMETWYMH